jgi:hypothetical protein
MIDLNPDQARKALTDELLTLDISEVTPEVGRPIEDLIFTMLDQGMVKEVSQAVLAAQKAWGTVPATRTHRGDLRFIPQINPFARFIHEGNPKFLQSIKDHFFGFTGAGLTLDMPESSYRVDAQRRYQYTLTLSKALAHFQGDFPGFSCTTKTQFSQFCRLFAERDIGDRASDFTWTKNLDFDYTNFHVWGDSSELNQYTLSQNLVDSAGFGKGFMHRTEDELTTDLDPRLLVRQKVLWASLTGASGVLHLVSLTRVHEYHACTAAQKVKFWWELMPKLIHVLSKNLDLDPLVVQKTLLIKGLEINFGGVERQFEIAIPEWLDVKNVLPLLKGKQRESVAYRMKMGEDEAAKNPSHLSNLLEDDLNL